MVRINLLPEEFRRRKRKVRISGSWWYAAAVVGGVCLVLMAVTLWQTSRIGRLETEILQTREEAERQKADLELVQELIALKESILKRMKVVEQLNQNRTRWIDILTAMSQSVPEDMWLTSFKESVIGDRSRARIQGMSFSLKPIALFMDRMEETPRFTHPEFTYAQRVPILEGMAYNFEILVDVFSYAKELASDQASSEEDLKGRNDQTKGKNNKG
jgi:Tfp pilus assembly protein PilN